MQTQTFQEMEEPLRMSDGFELFCRHWPASGRAERAVLFFHGIEVHSGACRFMGPELASRNADVYAFDRRGFGRSKEPDLPRGDTKDFDRHLADVGEVVDKVRSDHPGIKLFLFGHSIGCAYALWYAAHHPDKVDGLVLAASPLEAGFKLPTGDTLKLVLSPVYHHHHMYDLIDEWPQTFKLSEEYKLISEDPLCTKEFGLGYLFDVQSKLANKMDNNAEKVDKPVLLIHGDYDVVALPESSIKLKEKFASADKTLLTFDTADHWFYQSIIPTMSSKYDMEQKRSVSKPIQEWLSKH